MCRFGHLLALCIYKWPRGEQGEGVQTCIDEHPGAPFPGSPAFGELTEFPDSRAASAERACRERAED